MTPTIHYCLIATDKPLARKHQHPKKCPMYDDAISALLSKVNSTTDHRRTLKANNSVCVHYKMYQSVLYLCVADESVKLRTCFQLLDHLSEQYLLQLSSTDQSSSSTQRMLKEKLKYFNDPEKIDKFQKINDRVDELKDVMIHNIDELLEHMEKYDLMQGHTQELSDTSSHFARGSRKVKNNSCVVC